MCSKPYGTKVCRICRNCVMMKNNCHPDYLIINTIKNIGIEEIRSIIKKLYISSYYGSIKVIYLSKIELLTEQASNALLKTLEEPPENTYFIIECNNISNVLLTLRSRCMYWSITTPTEKNGLIWIKKSMDYTIENRIIITALRLCNNAPLEAKKLLFIEYWKYRLRILKNIENYLYNKYTLQTLLELLLISLNIFKNDTPLYWIISLFSDALKWNVGFKNFIINIDHINLIDNIAKYWNVTELYTQFKNWIQCRNKLNTINGINKELLLIYYLIKINK